MLKAAIYIMQVRSQLIFCSQKTKIEHLVKKCKIRALFPGHCIFTGPEKTRLFVSSYHLENTM